MGTQSVTLGSFNLGIVLMSFVISVFGSWCGLSAARRARRTATRAQWGWLFAAAVSIGGAAIWSMHFIGMLAYDANMRYSFNLPMTVGSLAAAIAAAMIGLTIATMVKGLAGYVVGGIVTGLGVCVMHYMGMYAMNMPAEMMWRTPVVILSVVIAVVAATLALFFTLNLDKAWMMFAAAVVMGIGVCVMHYTGMIALELKPDHDAMLSFEGGVDPLALALPIFAITSALLIALAFAGLIGESTDELEPINAPDNLATASELHEPMSAGQMARPAQMAQLVPVGQTQHMPQQGFPQQGLPQQRHGSGIPNVGNFRTVPQYGGGYRPQPAARPQRIQPQQLRPRPAQPQAPQTSQQYPGGQHVAGQTPAARNGSTSSGLPRRR